jgi:pentapeptide MXKDX repeat protein
MKPKTCPIALAACLLLGGVALADDTPSAQPVKSPKQKMHECMVQERANNSAMSKEDMKKACAAKLQSDENHPSRPHPTPDSTPD